MNEIDDDVFERAYQRMMFRRNQETLRREIYGDSVPEGDHWRGAEYPTVSRPTWRVRLREWWNRPMSEAQAEAFFNSTG